MISNISLGFLGIFLLIIIHEFGHFVFARLVGIRVEVFSVGFGPKLWKKQIGGTQYAFSLIPFGGYCKMAGEILVKDQKPEPGEMYYGQVWRRTLAVLGGPLFSLFGGWLFFILALFFPHIEDLTPNRIVISENSSIEKIIGKEAVIKFSELDFADGDKIIAINGKQTNYYNDIFRIFTTSAHQRLIFTVKRGVETVMVTATPLLLENGQGFLPLLPWYEPVLVKVREEYPAAQAGLQGGDQILEVNGQSISHWAEVSRLVRDSEGNSLTFKVENEKKIRVVTVYPLYDEELKKYLIGIESEGYKRVFVDGEQGIFPVIIKASQNFGDSLRLYVRGLGNLFRGVNLFQAISGPVKNTYFIGEVARTTVSQDDDGLKRVSFYNILTMLAFVNIALGVMNLLPIPLLDGGMLLLYGVEFLRGKYLTARALSIYQYIGLTFIVLLLLLSLSSDVFFILKR